MYVGKNQNTPGIVQRLLTERDMSEFSRFVVRYLFDILETIARYFRCGCDPVHSRADLPQRIGLERDPVDVS